MAQLRSIITKARARLLVRAPFLGSIALSLEWLCAPDIGTMATDGRRVWFNPSWCEEHGIEKTMGVIAHEVLGDKFQISFDGLLRGEVSWTRPNRRFVQHGLYLPGWRRIGPGRIAYVLDTSGSITAHELAIYTAGVLGILEETGLGEIVLIQCDARVRHVDYLRAGETFDRIEVHGRGGTRFQPAFDWIADSGLAFSAIVYATDLDCIDEPQEPGLPVIWLTPNRADHFSGVPWSPLPACRVELRMSQFVLLLAGLAIERVRCSPPERRDMNAAGQGGLAPVRYRVHGVAYCRVLMHFLDSLTWQTTMHRAAFTGSSLIAPYIVMLSLETLFPGAPRADL